MSTRIGFNKVLGSINGSSIVLSTPVVTCSDPDSAAFLLAAGITDPTISNAICNLVVGLKDDGIWNKITAIYPFVGGTASSHKYNLKDPRDLNAAYRLNFQGGWIHNSQGVKGNGVNTYADTYYSGALSMIGFYTPDETGGVAYGYSRNDESCDGDGNCSNFETKAVYLAPESAYFANTYFQPISQGFYGKGLGQIGGTFGFKNGVKISNAYGAIGGLEDTLPLGATRSVSFDSFGGIYGNIISSYNNLTHSFSYFSSVELSIAESANLYALVQEFETALGRQVAALNVDSDAFVFLNNARIDDVTNSITQINAINNLVGELKAQNLWNKMTDIYPIITDTRNLLSYTENFNVGVYWGSTFSSITINLVAPNGTTTGNTVVNSVGPNKSIFQTISVVSGNTYQFSFYIKKISGAYTNAQSVRLTSWGAAVASQTYTDLGTILTTDWVRYTHTFTATSTNNVYVQLVSNEIQTLGLWGAQLELGSSTTAYQAIPSLPSNRMAGQFLRNLKDFTVPIAGFNGGWTFSRTGAKPNGINAFAFTTRNFYNTFVSSNLNISAYSRTAITPSANRSLWGSSLPFSPYNGTVQATFTNASFNMNATLGGLGSNPISMDNTQGLIMTTATSSGGGSLRTYQNGVLKGTGSVSAGLPGSFFISAFNNNSTTTQYAPFELAFITTGLGLTPAEAAAFSTIVTVYQTALSRNV